MGVSVPSLHRDRVYQLSDMRVCVYVCVGAHVCVCVYVCVCVCVFVGGKTERDKEIWEEKKEQSWESFCSLYQRQSPVPRQT